MDVRMHGISITFIAKMTPHLHHQEHTINTHFSPHSILSSTTSNLLKSRQSSKMSHKYFILHAFFAYK
jgi:hypothetical protein